jgi:hypothetical protein
MFEEELRKVAEIEFSAALEKFKKNYSIDENGCWNWNGNLNYAGYGRICSKYLPEYFAHRLMWILANGPVPENLQICHRCNNRKCINPEHLYAGTAAENGHDRIGKNQKRKISRKRKNTRRIFEGDKEKILELFRSGKTKKEISKIYKLTPGYVGRIIKYSEKYSKD